MQAQIFNEPCIALSFFPSGLGEKKETSVELDNGNVILTRLCKKDDGILLRVFNSTDKPAATTLKIAETSAEIKLGAFEFSTFMFDGRKLTPTDTI